MADGTMERSRRIALCLDVCWAAFIWGSRTSARPARRLRRSSDSVRRPALAKPRHGALLAPVRLSLQRRATRVVINCHCLSGKTASGPDVGWCGRRRYAAVCCEPHPAGLNMNLETIYERSLSAKAPRSAVLVRTAWTRSTAAPWSPSPASSHHRRHQEEAPLARGTALHASAGSPVRWRPLRLRPSREYLEMARLHGLGLLLLPRSARAVASATCTRGRSHLRQSPQVMAGSDVWELRWIAADLLGSDKARETFASPEPAFNVVDEHDVYLLGGSTRINLKIRHRETRSSSKGCTNEQATASSDGALNSMRRCRRAPNSFGRCSIYWKGGSGRAARRCRECS